MPTDDCITSVPASEPTPEAAANPYLASALRAAAEARARTARIRAAQIGLSPAGEAVPVACPQAPVAAAIAPEADRDPGWKPVSPPPQRRFRFPRTMAEIERRVAGPRPAAAAAFSRRPSRLPGDADAPRTSLWTRLRSRVARWLLQ